MFTASEAGLSNDTVSAARSVVRMGWEAWVTLAVVAGTVYVLARELASPALTVLGATVSLLLAGVIDSTQAFAGFSNEAPITVAALYVLARAVQLTGALEPMVQRMMGERGGRRQLIRVVAPTAVASAFLNNTPIVAMVAPSVADWADRHGVPASRFLIPVSFAAVLGGSVTLIGTSTNLVVSGLLTDRGEPPLTMFELTPVGGPIAVVGCLLLATLSSRLLPDRKAARDTFEEGAREFSVGMRVIPGGPLEGRSVEEAGLRNLQGVYLVQVDRDGHELAPVAPSEVLRGGDVLTFVGRVDQIVDLQRMRGLVASEGHHFEQLGGRNGHQFYEAVVGSESPVLNRTLAEVDFRGRYQAAVLAIHRAGQLVDAKLGQVRLRLGDTLLLVADEDFRERHRDGRDFLLVARHGGRPPARSRKAPLVGAITFLLVFVAGAGLLPVLQAALAAVLALLASGALSLREARQAIDVDVLVVIAAAFGLGTAISESGLGDALAGGLLQVAEPFGPVAALAGVLVATLALTEAVSNNAAAVLAFPLAMSTAAAIGADPRPFAIAVTLGASLSFLTPIGYQTNLMVYGLGGYRFGDYARAGFPLNLMVIVLSLVLIPSVWPL